MSNGDRNRTTRSFRTAVIVAVCFGVVAAATTWYQTVHARHRDLAEVDQHSRDVLQAMTAPTAVALAGSDSGARAVLADRLEGYGRIVGFAAYRADGRLVAAGRAVRTMADTLPRLFDTALATRPSVVLSTHWQGLPVRVVAVGVRGPRGELRGVLAVVQDISYIDDQAVQRLTAAAVWILMLMLLVVMFIAAATWLTYDRQLHKLAEWMRRLRTENVPESPPPGLPNPLLVSESTRLAASLRAARSVGLSESEATVRSEMVWTRERLRAHAVACLKHGQLVVMSNREPYLHDLRDGEPVLTRPAGGLVSALDPVLQACGGLWIAHGAGSGDHQTADQFGHLTVPPDAPCYTLRRVWMTREEEQRYYYGFANQGLWPLCHLAHERPVFRASDWETYRRINQRFADIALTEMAQGDGMVLVQDYHLALVPQMIKAQRPDLRVGIFWHIPWPHPDIYRICPWRAEILAGMLGADLVGFHLQQYCNNFLDSVDRMIEARLERDRFVVSYGGHATAVRALPISVDETLPSAQLSGPLARTLERYRQSGVQIAVGVDRIDYTKGLPERFRAIRRLLRKYPEYAGRFSFVQLGAPSRTHIPRYRNLVTDLESLADAINREFGNDRWQPIHLLVGQTDGASVRAYLRLASICIVSSLHDGMNLVAKEFVAAQSEGSGVLILSEFAGAAHELPDALIINPYDIDGFADTIRAAFDLEPHERRSRMQRMHRAVEEHNVFRWAADLLTQLAATEPGGTPITPPTASGPSAPGQPVVPLERAGSIVDLAERA